MTNKSKISNFKFQTDPKPQFLDLNLGFGFWSLFGI